jgi:hypothetical protein
VILQNTGMLPVTAVTVAGAENNCSMSYMAPGDTRQCSMWSQVGPAADVYTIEVTGISGTVMGPKALPSVLTSSIQVAAPNATVALLQVLLAANSSIVTRAGQSVMLTATVVS